VAGVNGRSSHDGIINTIAIKTIAIKVTMSYLKRRIGQMIKQLRQAKGLTQAELAKKAQVTRPYITMLESGVKKTPSLPMLQRLAKALGVPVTALLSEEAPHD
jgi:DNA-binding XRE family transcriptional regulator